MELDELKRRLNKYLTHNLDSSLIDNKRLDRLAAKAGVSGQTIRNFLQGSIKKPQAKKIKALEAGLQSEESNLRRRKGQRRDH